MQDREAFAWQADWYRNKVRKHLGEATDDHFRLWMTEHALHGDVTFQEYPTQTVSYLGELQLALRQVAAWAERGIAPAQSTAYDVVDGQIVVPRDARERHGVQPTVSLTVDSSDRAEIGPGQGARFRVDAVAADLGGTIIEVQWDFDDSGEFKERDQVQPAKAVAVERTRSFTESGTHFVTAKVVAQQDGDAESPFARLENLARVRVVIS
jgi:hypothetical protein